MITLVNPTTAPTDKSIPPVMITKVSPIPRIAVMAPCRSRLVMLPYVQKLDVLNASNTHRSARRTRRVKLSSAPTRARCFVAANCRAASVASTLILNLLQNAIHDVPSLLSSGLRRPSPRLESFHAALSRSHERYHESRRAAHDERHVTCRRYRTPPANRRRSR